MFNLSIHGSHNATVAISFKDTVLEAIELERLTTSKNDALFCGYGLHPAGSVEERSRALHLLERIRDYLIDKYGVLEYDNVAYNSVPDEDVLKQVFPANRYLPVPHHVAHAASGLYQSPYQRALIVTFDGGSDSGFFNIYVGDKGALNPFTHVHQGSIDLATAYSTVGNFTGPIKYELNPWVGNLVYAGKLMGLAAFGRQPAKYTRALLKFYQSNTDDHVGNALERFKQATGLERLSGQDAYDLAAANQAIFELVFRREIDAALKAYPNLPLIFSGGGALNILNNTKLLKERAIFVGPTPNDSGLAVGMLAYMIRPHDPIDATYLGPEAWDKYELDNYRQLHRGKALSMHEVRDAILAGKIIGLVQGRSEHGARALGNRSIICNPAHSSMKDMLNEKIKQREFYRPFAPVVRLQDVSTFFEWQTESRWMSFSPKVREEWRDVLQAITHADGTARVQTVTQEQNPFIYDLLTEIAMTGAPGVLLNTSFNIAGKPILNSYHDALQVFNSTQMDGLILEKVYFSK